MATTLDTYLRAGGAASSVTLSGHLGPAATSEVLLSSDGLQVRWVDTRRHAAQMVKVEAGGDRPDDQLEGNPVRRPHASSLPLDPSISVGMTPGQPQPARPEVLRVIGDRPVLVDLPPEPINALGKVHELMRFPSGIRVAMVQPAAIVHRAEPSAVGDPDALVDCAHGRTLLVEGDD